MVNKRSDERVWRVVAVSGDRQRAELLDRLSKDPGEYDIALVESLDGGYSRIKKVRPDLVILLIEIDDVAACQLLSMLKSDEDLCGIPVVTRVTKSVNFEFDDIVSAVMEEASCATHALQMN